MVTRLALIDLIELLYCFFFYRSSNLLLPQITFINLNAELWPQYVPLSHSKAVYNVFGVRVARLHDLVFLFSI